MNILAIDTTSKKASVSILEDNNEVFKNTIDNDITHSEKLMPLIDDSLKQTNLTLKDIDLLACVLGPGSFTGIRIGIASVKALAKVLNKKIFGISTLEVMAYGLIKDLDTNQNKDNNKNQYILSVMDAKNKRVYYSLYVLSNVDSPPYLGTLLEGSNTNIDECANNINNYFNALDNVNIAVAIDNTDISLNIEKSHSTFNTCSDTDIVINIIQSWSKTDVINNYMFDYLTLDAIYARKSVAEREKYGE